MSIGTRRSTPTRGYTGGSAEVGNMRGAPIWRHAMPRLRNDRAPRAVKHEIVVVAAPIAAARTASMFLVGLPRTFSLPLVLLLGGATREEREPIVSLQAHCAMPLRVVDDADPIMPGHIYIAPGDYHLLVENNHFALSAAPPYRGARPSIDVLLESVADAFGARAVCVLLGHDKRGDGRAGASKVRDRGGGVIVENPATAAVGEPTPPAEGPFAAEVLHLSEIASFVSNLGELEVT
jgi:two-component system chemotaxis response regulator CheB